jgi:diaminopimelate decarboxylase
MEQTPYFIFKPEKLKTNYQEFEKLAKQYLKDYIIAYSVKTNTSEQVINTLNNLGSNFEVASLKEINLTPNKSKIFNSPCKTEQELEIAINNKFLINVDSESEIDKITKILDNKPFNIGLRISTNKSKFGFDEKQLEKAIKYAKSKNLAVICLQIHAGTQQTISNFSINLKKSAKIIEDLQKKIKNLDLKYIDVGGGFPDKTQLKNIKATTEDYFKEIKNNLGKFNTSIILEPGRNLVSDAFELITKVHVIKETENKKYAILDVGINLLQRTTLSEYKFSKINPPKTNHTPLPTPNAKKQEYILAGPLLFSSDTMGKINENLQEQDLIKIENVGAYCYNLAWTISYDKPEIITE